MDANNESKQKYISELIRQNTWISAHRKEKIENARDFENRMYAVFQRIFGCVERYHYLDLGNHKGYFLQMFIKDSNIAIEVAYCEKDKERAKTIRKAGITLIRVKYCRISNPNCNYEEVAKAIAESIEKKRKKLYCVTCKHHYRMKRVDDCDRCAFKNGCIVGMYDFCAEYEKATPAHIKANAPDVYNNRDRSRDNPKEKKPVKAKDVSKKYEQEKEEERKKEEEPAKPRIRNRALRKLTHEVEKSKAKDVEIPRKVLYKKGEPVQKCRRKRKKEPLCQNCFFILHKKKEWYCKNLKRFVAPDSKCPKFNGEEREKVLPPETPAKPRGPRPGRRTTNTIDNT